ncbi:hypothetical protein SLEP1_g18023 [Rubroshorea leprosula]|uniref:Protein kinase domain-containing protein n=1 Tax=Rubroshorea leprosula TaxID=152421 RepID=A0AAV5J585_9ROSI|nr:hypothetical protein SLEP1_g18023 [Rubroshorea leprosula]
MADKNPFNFLLLLFFFQAPGTLSFIFNGFNGSETNLTREGASIVKPSGALELTNQSRNITGHAFYSKPTQMLNKSTSNASSFSTNLVFAIVPPSSGQGGYGLAFTLSPSPNFTGAETAHYMGIFNSSCDSNPSNHIFAVEFDTVKGFEEKHEAKGNHVGININSMSSNSSRLASYYYSDHNNEEYIDLESGDPVQACIEYDGITNLVNVTIFPRGNHVRGFLRLHRTTEDELSLHLMLEFFDQWKSFAAQYFPTSSATPEEERFPCFWVLKSREDLEDWELDCPHRFQYRDLYIATKRFKDSEIIGIGGFGKVYRGVLPTNGTEVAVKRIARSSMQGLREFAAEIESLGKLRHKNLINLQGWCKKKNDLLLIYDYIPYGSLYSLLFERRDGLILSWEQSNVLIDADMNARLGDFGLAGLYNRDTVSHTTNIVGTIGYIAPELARNGKASTSSDIFAYGRMGQALGTVDPKLGSSYVVEEMNLVLELGLLCTHYKPEFRPRMRQMLRYLNGDDQLPPSIQNWGSYDSREEVYSRFLEAISSDTISWSSYPSSSSDAFSLSVL